ncbi:tetratricopeptide repeat protein [Candidatus Palauibacter sp.]|uniref:tetratricopeptide repeat protein n=1 Tax=Candidatus Palauibacter sp. TaxID=3101350 RepID=UPI003B52CAB6
MKRWSMMLPAFLLGAMLSMVPAQVEAQFDEVGSITFPTSATGEAQQHFLRGVAILHSFGWKQAREQFHAAQELDPDFVMAYWGESLAYNHPLVSQMDPTEPRKALERLGATPAERMAKAPTDREKGFLKAVEILWSEADHVDRRVGYMEAMRDLYEAYPEDPEISAFYALSLLSATAATRDLSQRWNVMAGTIALRLFNDNPMHPGAAHYTIHSFDNPIMAPLALDAAYAFADIAPAVSHARHMPTHIFIQHGMWERVSGNNQSAYNVAQELWQPGDPVGDAVHALDWGQYGDLQRGDYDKARLWMDRLGDMVDNEGFGTATGARGAAGIARAQGAVSLLRARYIVETEQWETQPITEDSPAHELLATGLSAHRMGDQETVTAAEAALKEMSDGEGYTHVMHKQVGALRHAAMGHPDVATGLMDEAEAEVMSMAPPRGSASPVKPMHELYGELLLELGMPDKAVEKFETSLLRMPNRPRSLLGLARAHAANGDAVLAAEAYAKVADLWSGLAHAGLMEAEAFLHEAESEGNQGNR